MIGFGQTFPNSITHNMVRVLALQHLCDQKPHYNTPKTIRLRLKHPNLCPERQALRPFTRPCLPEWAEYFKDDEYFNQKV
jgi:hypothetical protein